MKCIAFCLSINVTRFASLMKQILKCLEMVV